MNQTHSSGTLTKIIKAIKAADVLGEFKRRTPHSYRTLVARVLANGTEGVGDGQGVHGDLAVEQGKGHYSSYSYITKELDSYYLTHALPREKTTAFFIYLLYYLGEGPLFTLHIKSY